MNLILRRHTFHAFALRIRHTFRRLLLSRRRYRARRAFRLNYTAWKKTGDSAAWDNVNLLAARLRELESGKAF